MSPLFTLLRRDALLLVRNRLLAVGLGVALLLGGLVRWALPDTVAPPPTWVHEAPGLDLLAGVDPAELPPERRLGSAAAVRAAVAADPAAAGLVLEGPRQVRVLSQAQAPTTQALQQTAAWGLLTHLEGRDGRPPVRRLRGELPPLPLRFALLPVLLTADALFLGFLFGAVMVLQERSERTLHAYRVSPAGTGPWVLSKALVNSAASMLYAAVIVAVAGAPVRWGLLLAVVGVGSAALTLGGMALAVFFRTLMELLYPLLVVNALLLLPLGASFLPGAEGAWLRALPTWPAVMGLREALLPGSGPGLWLTLAQGLLPWLLGLGLACWAVVERRLMKEAS